MTNNIPVVTHGDLPAMMEMAHVAMKPLMVWGSPGIGKSQVVAQYADSIGAELVDIRLSQYEAVDIRGLPDIKDGATVWAAPSTLPFEGSRFPTDRPIILFLDELMHAPASVLSVAFQLVLDRAVGEHKLMPNVYVIAASNRATDRAGVGKMPTPLANRFLHCEVVADFDAWRKWAEAKEIATPIIGYLSRFPQNLDQFDGSLKNQAMAFPTPRAWQSVDSLLRVGAGNPVIRDRMVLTAVGEAVGTEFNAFVRIADRVPHITEILESPETCRLPVEIDAQYACVAMLVRYADADNLGDMLTYVRRLSMEYTAMWLADVLRTKPQLALVVLPDGKSLPVLQIELDQRVRA